MDHVIRPAQAADILQDAVRRRSWWNWVYRLLLSFLTLPSNWVKTDSQFAYYAACAAGACAAEVAFDLSATDPVALAAMISWGAIIAGQKR